MFKHYVEATFSSIKNIGFNMQIFSQILFTKPNNALQQICFQT